MLFVMGHRKKCCYGIRLIIVWCLLYGKKQEVQRHGNGRAESKYAGGAGVVAPSGTIESQYAAGRGRNHFGLYGRENPPHPEIWINYFLKMMGLYSKKFVNDRRHQRKMN